jgi:UDP-N-acetyl-D-glucosamine dehydrogenase
MTIVQAPIEEMSEIVTGRCRVGVVGLGYAGLPQVMAFAAAGHSVVGIDVNDAVVTALRAGRSPVDTVSDSEVAALQDSLRFSTDAIELATCSAVMICVPTPVDDIGTPDLSALRAATHTIAKHLVPGQLIVVESTVHPGATDTVVRPILESSGLVAGVHFNLVFAPERIDPGNRHYGPVNTPKVVGGFTPICTWRATELYRGVTAKVHAVNGLREAEAAKILENTYRQVNLALVHEFAAYCETIGIDVTETIEAAATKPFGFQPFFPGTGVGGHCIPVDPLYLAASARSHGVPMRLVEMAQEINDDRPVRVADQCRRRLDAAGVSIADATVLVLGLTYKPNVADMRNSPVVSVVRHLRKMGADVAVHDPFVTGVDVDGSTLNCVDDLATAVREADLVLLAQRHTAYDDSVLRHATLLLHAGGRPSVDREQKP